jgi:osmotically-inducible protein OsmY
VGTDSDRDLVEAVSQALGSTGYPALRDIHVELEQGIVVLWGYVATYHQKQLAQVTAQRVDGVRGIANGIEVLCCR